MGYDWYLGLVGSAVISRDHALRRRSSETTSSMNIEPRPPNHHSQERKRVVCAKKKPSIGIRWPGGGDDKTISSGTWLFQEHEEIESVEYHYKADPCLMPCPSPDFRRAGFCH